MNAAIRLISNEINVHINAPKNKYLIAQRTFIFPRPKGRVTIVGFVEHAVSSRKIHPIVASAIEKDLGIVYVCDKLPDNPIVHPNIVYIETGWKWLIHTLFMNPLAFKGVFWQGQTEKLARAFSCFTKYKIPIIETVNQIKDFSEKAVKAQNRVLLEITGGIGDNLMVIPTIKTLADNGKEVHLLVDKGRTEVFNNLDFIKCIYFDRKEIDVSKFDAIYWLNFGSILNDYRRDVNKQNRIFSIAEICGLCKDELVIRKPEIGLTEQELKTAKLKWGSYSKKVFFGFDRARHDNKIPQEKVQEVITKLKSKGYTVFIGSNKAYSFTDCINLTKQLQLRELFSLINEMDYVLTVDTSFLHIAAALNKKTFVLMNYFQPSWRCETYDTVRVYTPNVSCKFCAGGQYKSAIERQCVNGRSCFSFFDWNEIIENISGRIKRKGTILIKSLTGELGDKLVIRALIPEVKKKYKDYKIDVLIESERFNTIDGYFRFFDGYINKCFIDKTQINEYCYEKVFDVSAHSIHNEEILTTKNKGFQMSRYQRWADRMGITFKGKVNANYKVKHSERVWNDLKLKNLKNPIIGIAPFSSNRTKDWEMFGFVTPKWQKIIDYLHSKGCNVVTFHYLPLKYKNCLNLGNLNPEELGFALSRLALFIGVEAGISHFCGILGIPMAVLIGSSSPLVLRHYNKVRIVHKGKCHSCNRFIVSNFEDCKCSSLDNNPNSECLYNITVREVQEEIADFAGKYLYKKFMVRL